MWWVLSFFFFFGGGIGVVIGLLPMKERGDVALR